jgi:hypothetical protein
VGQGKGITNVGDISQITPMSQDGHIMAQKFIEFLKTIASIKSHKDRRYQCLV